jgi:hypothetical protein
MWSAEGYSSQTYMQSLHLFTPQRVITHSMKHRVGAYRITLTGLNRLVDIVTGGKTA